MLDLCGGRPGPLAVGRGGGVRPGIPDGATAFAEAGSTVFNRPERGDDRPTPPTKRPGASLDPRAGRRPTGSRDDPSGRPAPADSRASVPAPVRGIVQGRTVGQSSKFAARTRTTDRDRRGRSPSSGRPVLARRPARSPSCRFETPRTASGRSPRNGPRPKGPPFWGVFPIDAFTPQGHDSGSRQTPRESNGCAAPPRPSRGLRCGGTGGGRRGGPASFQGQAAVRTPGPKVRKNKRVF